jgi:hypothetical protein
MNRIACALLLFAVPGSLWAQAPTEPAEDKPMYGDRQPGSVTVEQGLAMRIPAVHLENRPLQEAIEWVRGASGMNIVVHWKQLAAAGIPPETPITLHLADVPLQRVLELILQLATDGPELGYEDDQNVLIVSTQADLDRNLVVRSYDVSGWAPPPKDVRPPVMRLDEASTPFYLYEYAPYIYYEPFQYFGHPPLGYEFEQEEEEPYQDLIDMITSAVEPESWTINGGRGTITPIGSALVIRNCSRVHRMLMESLGLRPISKPAKREARPTKADD